MNRKSYGMNMAVGIWKLVVFCLLTFLTSLTIAMTGGDYEISWSTIDGGGGTSTGGDYALVGTIGQPDAGQMSGGDYTLSGGFWPRGPDALLLCIVNFEHFAELYLRWLDSPCNVGNNFCDGADLDGSGSVGLSDIGELAYWWLCTCPEDWPWQ